MNKLLIPLVILLSSFLYSVFWWNPERRPYCDNSDDSSALVGVPLEAEELPAPPPPPVEEDTAQLNLTPVEKALFVPLDVYFQSGSANIIRTKEVEDWLALAKKYLAENPNEKLSLVGHTDSDGSDELNQGLSERRSVKVRDILAGEGFVSSNLVTSGKGEKEPIGDNGTDEGKSKNRRVSIKLIK